MIKLKKIRYWEKFKEGGRKISLEEFDNAEDVGNLVEFLNLQNHPKLTEFVKVEYVETWEDGELVEIENYNFLKIKYDIREIAKLSGKSKYLLKAINNYSTFFEISENTFLNKKGIKISNEWNCRELTKKTIDKLDDIGYANYGNCFLICAFEEKAKKYELIEILYV